MKWESLLVLLILLFPLLQGLLEQARKKHPPPQGELPEDELWMGELPDAPPERSVPAPPPPVPVEAVPAPPRPRPVPERRARPRPEARPAPEVVSLESLAPRAEPPTEAKPRRATQTRLRPVAVEPEPAHRADAAARVHLRGTGELRRAVLMAEILGPPRALRPPGENPGS